jgi:LPS-assembly protein
LYFLRLILLGVLALGVAASAQPQTFQTKEPPPSEPPASIPLEHWDVNGFASQEMNNDEYVWTGHPVEFVDSRRLFRADEVHYNRGTGVITARGHVYFRSFDRNDQVWCDHLEYDTDNDKGKFYDVIGETMPRIVARPGVLTVNAPFHFQGQWAERTGEKYILYRGWVTNCKLPKPWWRLRGARFDVIPDHRSISYKTWFFVRGIPLFYTPFFYHSLEKEPRRSGILVPSGGHSSIGGFMLMLGGYWAINRSYDLTYRLTDYISRADAHHIDFRGKPRPGTDFDIIFYGVRDRGVPDSGDPPRKFGGFSFYGVGSSDLGRGWTARASVTYISSYDFRQYWTQSFNEAIGSEIHATGFINKNLGTFTFDAAFSRLQNYENVEQQVFDPATGTTSRRSDAVTIRKLPEVDFGSRDRQIFHGIPVWFSFDSSAGLVERSEPFIEHSSTASNPYTLAGDFQTGNFMTRFHLAPHVTTAFHLGALNLVPSIGIDETLYSEGQASVPNQFTGQNQNVVVGTNLVRSARDFSLNIIFPPLVRVFNKKTIFGDKLKHVIEPRATYRYVTGVSSDRCVAEANSDQCKMETVSDFNRFIRFDQTDLLANTSEVEISLTNRLYAKRGNSVQEIFTWELAQKRYFDPTFGGAVVPGQPNIFTTTADVTGIAFMVGPRTYSPVVSSLRISPVNGFAIRWQADYDPYIKHLTDSSFALDYNRKKFALSAGNDEIHTSPLLFAPANQFRARAAYGDPNKKGWNAGVVSVYDYDQRKILYTTMQVTYNTDCCGFSVEYHRYNVGISDQGQWRAAFVIGNIGSFGTLRKQDRVF